MDVLKADAVDEALTRTGLGWERRGSELERTWTGADFVASLAFVNAVGELAEAANHHPDIDIRWNRVMLHLSTHDAGGITQRDLDLAAQIDALVSRLD